eukprot:scaffold13454_cov114-Isochrysis_galbana.AAC.1
MVARPVGAAPVASTQQLFRALPRWCAPFRCRSRLWHCLPTGLQDRQRGCGVRTAVAAQPALQNWPRRSKQCVERAGAWRGAYTAARAVREGGDRNGEAMGSIAPADLVRRGVRRALSLSALHAACSSAARSNGESLVSVSSAPLELANTTAYISVSSTTPTLVAAAHVSSKKAERNPACARPCAPTHNMRRD